MGQLLWLFSSLPSSAKICVLSEGSDAGCFWAVRWLRGCVIPVRDLLQSFNEWMWFTLSDEKIALYNLLSKRKANKKF